MPMPHPSGVYFKSFSPTSTLALTDFPISLLLISAFLAFIFLTSSRFLTSLMLPNFATRSEHPGQRAPKKILMCHYDRFYNAFTRTLTQKDHSHVFDSLAFVHVFQASAIHFEKEVQDHWHQALQNQTEANQSFLNKIKHVRHPALNHIDCA